MRRKARIHLRAPLVTLFILAFSLAWDGSGILRTGLLCALLHEAGHLVTYRFLWGNWPDLQVSPFGLCILLRGKFFRPEEELILAAAGPMVNLLVCGTVLWYMHSTGQYCYRGYWLACTNLLVGGTNLLPLPGLDGQRILHSLLFR